MVATSAKLITIPFSHYCEKARWALDRAGVAYEEDGHLPIFHYRPVKKAGGKKTVPILRTPDRDAPPIADSTEIVAWADAHKPGCLLPADDKVRAEALAIEDHLDNDLGPAARRWGYSHLLPRKDLDAMMVGVVPRWELRMLKITRPIAYGMLRRGLKIDAAGVERSRQKIEDSFAYVHDRLRDGRRYLAGDAFTVADLTLAALASAVLLPRAHPVRLPEAESFPPEPRDQIERWRDTAAGRHALLMYQTERT
jgi:glutathione S-transferase